MAGVVACLGLDALNVAGEPGEEIEVVDAVLSECANMGLANGALTMRIGIYLRISEDPDGTSTATKRQRADCRKFAKSRGWEVVDVFEDVDVSAFKKGVTRPEFQRMLESVKAREVDGILAWKMDRISRRQHDLVLLDEACEDAGAAILTVTEGINTSEPTGRFVAELLTAQARMESENSSMRIKRKHLEMAKEGRPALGGTRPFGYSPKRTKIIAKEAKLIREAVGRITAGESIRGICRDWQERGVKTPTGKAWARTPLRRMLLSACIRGQRDHNGVLTTGTWKAIITADEGAAVAHVLTDRAGPARVAARSYLLTGFAFCGRCKEPLSAKAKPGVRRYICSKDGGRVNNCGRLARVAEPVEELVRDSVLVALGGADLRQYMAKSNGGQAGELAILIEVDEKAKQQLSDDYYVDQRIERAEFFRTRDRLAGRIETNRAKMAKTNGRGMLNSIIGAGEAVREQWGDAGLDWQRAVIAAMVDRVEIAPAVKGRTKFDPSLVKIVWKF